MKDPRTGTGLLGVVASALLAGCSAGATPELGQAEALVSDLVAWTTPRSAPSREEQIRFQAFRRFSSGDPHEASWIRERPPQEQDLLRLGGVSVDPILSALRAPETNRDLRARLAILLGEIGERRASAGLLEIFSGERDLLVRQACVLGLGLIRSPENLSPLKKLLSEGGAFDRSVRWAMAMSGDSEQRDRYLSTVKALLKEEVLDDVAAEAGVEKRYPSPEGKHLWLQARVTPENEDLYLDAWRLAQLDDLRAVALLVDALAYHEARVQHVALHFLAALVQSPFTTRAWTEYELHSLESHRCWSRWWSEAGPKLRWNSRRRTFGVPE